MRVEYQNPEPASAAAPAGSGAFPTFRRLRGCRRRSGGPTPSRQILFALLLVAGAWLAAPATATTVPGETVRREIIALYDSREEAKPDLTRIHRFAEMPLNHLGFIATYWDVAKGLPDAARLSNARGILIWLQRPQPATFYQWAERQVQDGVRVVVFGDPGTRAGAASTEAARLFEAIGLRMTGNSVDLTYRSRVLYRDALIGFEHPLDPVLPPYPIATPFGSDVVSHLVLQNRDASSSLTSSVVVTSDRGGYVASGYLIYEEPGLGRSQWIIDPFAFFAQAFGREMMPIPDVTTLSGRRIYFSHIDGDGWNNLSRIENYRDRQIDSARVVLDELIAPYPDLPVSVGVIAADVDDRYGMPHTAVRSARAIYALPQVEVASHTYTHPFDWPFFEHYDREREEIALGLADKRQALFGTRLRQLVKKLLPGVTRRPDHEHKVDEHDPPRAYAEFPFDLDQEIEGAIDVSESLAPEGKSGMLLLWSGSADPFEAAVARTRRLGLRNLNGGDSRDDPDYPSVSYLSPLSRVVGRERQIYAGMANDYLFSNDGNVREHGYLHLDATIAATESPRRLKPINIYYHIYAGENAARLAAVRHHLDNARKAALAPIAASRYAAMVDGFFDTRIIALDGQAWWIRDRGALQTLRFDDAAALSVDFSRSVGVLGQNRKGDALYVALDDAETEPVVALTAAATAAAPPPHLVEARWSFRGLERKPCGFTVTAAGYGPGEMRWGGFAAGRYRVLIGRGPDRLFEAKVEVGADGILAVSPPVDAIAPVTLDVACTAAQGAS